MFRLVNLNALGMVWICANAIKFRMRVVHFVHLGRYMKVRA
jgi:hypothetical protein